MAFSEVPAALRAGMVDGPKNPVSTRYIQSMHEVRSESLRC